MMSKKLTRTNEREVSQKENPVSLLTLFFSLSIVTGFINKQQYGGGLSTQILFIGCFFLFLFISNKKIKINISHIVLVLFWGITFISTAISNVVSVRQDIITFLIYVIFYICITGIKFKKKDIRIIIRTYISASLIGAISIIINFFLDNQYGWKRYTTTFFGVSKDPNYASGFMLSALLLMLFSLFNKNKENNFLNFFIIGTLLAGILITGSRAAFVFVLFIIFYTFIIYIIRYKTNILYKFFVVIFIALAASMLINIFLNILPNDTVERLTEFSTYTDDIRLIYWSEIINQFQEFPLVKQLFGQGLNSSNAILIYLSDANTHNVYIDILLASGVVGFSSFITIVIYNILGKKEDWIYILGLSITFLGPLLFINGFNTPSFWTPMILLGIFKRYSIHSEEKLYQWF